MKFNKKTKSAIWHEAKDKIGGFGMWLEAGERQTFADDVYYTNRLRKDDEETDLWDFIHWNDFCDFDFELINGHTLIDFYVHDKDWLVDNLLILLNEKGEIIKSFTITEAVQKESHEFLKQYEEQ